MNGENLFNAAHVIDKAGREIDAMLYKLSEILKKELPYEIEYNGNDWEQTDWIRTDYLHEYKIKNSGRGKKPTYLAIQIKLADNEESNIIGRKIPLLYVLFSGKGAWDVNEFTLHTILNDEEKWELKGNCLWEYYDDNEDKDRPWYKSMWAFIIPLTTLNNEDDLRNNIVVPIIKIFKNQNPMVELKKSKKILQFKIINGNIKATSL